MSFALLFFVSGFAGLVYEVVWLRELGLLFGNTTEAAAATLSLFFASLAIGQRALAPRVGELAAPLATYGVLEIALAIAAGTYVAVASLYAAVYPRLFAAFGGEPLAAAVIKLALSAVAIVPTGTLLGATLPVMIEASHRRQSSRASAPLLYAANTLGAAGGALAAGFWLPPALGYRGTCIVAMVLSSMTGLAALVLSRLYGSRSASSHARIEAMPSSSLPGRLRVVAFASGFLAVGLEVLWTRMFAQVLHNSVYSFAMILVVFLLGLGCGAGVSARLASRQLAPEAVLAATLLACAITVAATPFAFDYLTGGLEYVARDLGWRGYVASTARVTTLVLLVPAILVGMVFPSSWRIAVSHTSASGGHVGRATALNSLGCAVGPLFVGFGLLPFCGLWRSIEAIALGYAALGIAMATGPAARRLRPCAWIAGAAILATVANAHLPSIRTDAAAGDHVLEITEAPQGTVAVVERGPSRWLKIDNYYTVGGNGAPENDRRQAYLPLLAHVGPKSVFFLGMGTGITAAAALRYPIDRLVTAELVPAIAAAARRHFAEYATPLFTDSRSTVVLADGRHHLAASAERYDVVVSDMFIPWQAGASDLYSREHFASVRTHLRPGGLFALWLPLYQLSIDEFSIIARTMMDVFPLVTLWRGDFLARTPIVALFGHWAEDAIDPERLAENISRVEGAGDVPAELARALVLLFYAGNVTAAKDQFRDYPINTDDLPAIAFRAPITQREVAAGANTWLTSVHLLAVFDRLASAMPPEVDPYLHNVSSADRAHVDAGRALHGVFANVDVQDFDGARDRFHDFIDSASADVYRMFRDQIPSLAPDTHDR